MRVGITISFIVFLFLSSCALIIQREIKFGKAAECEKVFKLLKEQANQKFENIQRLASPRVQISNLLFLFQESASDIFAKYKGAEAAIRVKTLYNRKFWKYLPPNEIAMMKIDLLETRPVFTQFWGMGFSTVLARDLADCYFQEFRKVPIPSHTIELCEKKVRKILHYPQSLENLFNVKRLNSLQFYNSSQGNFGFYHGKFFSRDNSQRFILFSFLNLNKMDPELGFRALADFWEEKDSGVVLISDLWKKPIVSRIFKENPQLYGYLARVLKNGFKNRNYEELGGFLFFSESVPSEMPFRALLVFKIPYDFDAARARRKIIFAVSLILVLLGLFASVEKTVFNRGPRIKLGAVLVGTFLFATILPVVGIYIFSKRGMEEFARISNQGVVRDLHQKLTGLDEKILYHSSNFVQRINCLKTKPFIGKRIFWEEKHPERKLHPETTQLLAAFLRLVHPQIESQCPFATLITIFGGNKFTRIWAGSETE